MTPHPSRPHRAPAQPGQTVHSGDGRITVYHTPGHVAIGRDGDIVYPLTPMLPSEGGPESPAPARGSDFRG